LIQSQIIDPQPTSWFVALNLRVSKLLLVLSFKLLWRIQTNHWGSLQKSHQESVQNCLMDSQSEGWTALSYAPRHRLDSPGKIRFDLLHN
jgi:hypothetical protein